MTGPSRPALSEFRTAAGRLEQCLATLLARLDAADAESWEPGFFRRLRAAIQTEVNAAILGVIGKLTDEDQTRLMTIARNPPPSPTDGCWSVQTIMDGLAAMPIADLGPVVRTMFGATAPGTNQ
jgi:hypothetical protein